MFPDISRNLAVIIEDNSQLILDVYKQTENSEEDIIKETDG